MARSTYSKKYDLVITIGLSVLFTTILLCFRNKSNFKIFYIVPIIVALLVKYIQGDWDHGYTWSLSDVFYWITIILTSLFIIGLFSCMKFTSQL